MAQLRVLVVGASIAGPTAAYWLAKAGAKVTVVERFPELRSGGQNVDIRTAGVAVMRKMPGMEEAVRANKAPMDGISFVDPHGKSYGTIRATGDPNQQSLVSEYEIFRGDLAKILYDLTKDNENINYVFGEQVVAMEHGEDDGPITVEFMNGYPTQTFDLVAACDGATSRTRAIGLGAGVRDHIEPVNAFAAYFTTPRDYLQGDTVGQAYSAVGGRFVGVGPDPSGANRVTLMGIFPRNGPDATQPFREAMKRGDAALKAYLRQHYQGAGWRFDDILDDMMAADDFYASEIVQVKTPRLSRGRFVLVGDAGHAPGPTGTGTSLAMAGAYVLAGEVGRHPGDLAAGLRAYEASMRPLVGELQKIPPLVPAVFAPTTAWGLWFRNAVFSFVCWTRILDYAQSFFAGSFANAEKHAVPEYTWVA